MPHPLMPNSTANHQAGEPLISSDEKSGDKYKALHLRCTTNQPVKFRPAWSRHILQLLSKTWKALFVIQTASY